jgi:hypothetical protein
MLKNISENRMISFENRIKRLFNNVKDEQIKTLIKEKIGFNNFIKVL